MFSSLLSVCTPQFSAPCRLVTLLCLDFQCFSCNDLLSVFLFLIPHHWCVYSMFKVPAGFLLLLGLWTVTFVSLHCFCMCCWSKSGAGELSLLSTFCCFRALTSGSGAELPPQPPDLDFKMDPVNSALHCQVSNERVLVAKCESKCMKVDPCRKPFRWAFQNTTGSSSTW